MKNVFDYEDVQLIPAKCIVKSRSECDTSVSFGGRTFKLPVVPSNMQTIIDEEIALFLAENGYFYVMHRFKPEERATFIKDMHKRGLIASISVGVKQNEYEFINLFEKYILIPYFFYNDITPHIYTLVLHNHISYHHF